MTDPQIIGALREKRVHLAEVTSKLERQVVQHRANLIHLDAAMRLFDPEGQPDDLDPAPQRSAWFRPGKCLRLIYDVLRPAPQPVTTRALTEQVMGLKAITVTDERQLALVQKTILGSLSRAKGTIQRVPSDGVVAWRIG